MTSKYDAVFARLDKIVNVENKYQEKINAVKIKMLSNGVKCNATTLALGYAVCRREKELLADKMSEVQLRLDAVTQLMCDAYEIEGTTSLTLANGDKVRVQPKLYVGFPDLEAFRLWCLESEDLAKKMRLMPQTASSLVGEMLLNGEPEPPGVKASVVDQVVFTQGE